MKYQEFKEIIQKINPSQIDIEEVNIGEIQAFGQKLRDFVRVFDSRVDYKAICHRFNNILSTERTRVEEEQK